jgi:FHS family L-fucose permease-like MFS transporter
LAKKSVLQFPQLALGMIAIFVYVGVEVSTASNLPEFMRQQLNIPTSEAASYVSLFWASLMIGRWSAATGVFGFSKHVKLILNVIVPYAAFALFILVNKLAHHNIEPFYNYVFVIPVLIIADMLSKGNPARQLFIFSTIGILALLIGMFSSGLLSIYAFISVGLFCSTLWPCIFTLAIAGLGKQTNQGSGFLIMMIMGGGFISLLQGFLADENLLGIQWSYLVGVACFTYLAFYAVSAKNILAKQGVVISSNN